MTKVELLLYMQPLLMSKIAVVFHYVGVEEPGGCAVTVNTSIKSPRTHGG